MLHTIGTGEFHVGHCISWEYTNSTNVVAAEKEQKQRETEEYSDSAAGKGKPHGLRVKHINIENPIPPIQTHYSSLLAETRS